MRSMFSGFLTLVPVLWSLYYEAEAMPAFRKQVIPKTVSKIIGGTAASDGRYSFAQVSLQLPGFPADVHAHECGGSVIAPDMVLTAGHCSKWFTLINVDRYDFNDPNDKYYAHTIHSVAVHPLFDKDTFRYDFSVVQTNESVLFITPVRLNKDPAVPAVHEVLTVLGWGAIENDSQGAIYPSVFQKGRVLAMSNQNCADAVIANQSLYTGDVYSDMMCAQAPGVDACSGDSGGPLIVEGSSEGLDLQVGLVSWGRGCAVYPGVYSRISAGYDWIREQVCFKSVNPPSYMLCLDAERDPKYVPLLPSGKALNSTSAKSTASPQTELLTRTPSASPRETPKLQTIAPAPAPASVKLPQAPVSDQATGTSNVQNSAQQTSSVAASTIFWCRLIFLVSGASLIL